MIVESDVRPTPAPHDGKAGGLLASLGVVDLLLGLGFRVLVYENV